MQTIVVEKSVEELLNRVPEQVTLCGSDGNVLGYFLPVVAASQYRGVNSPTPIEELRRREAAGGGRPLKDILADLEKRA